MVHPYSTDLLLPTFSPMLLYCTNEVLCCTSYLIRRTGNTIIQSTPYSPFCKNGSPMRMRGRSSSGADYGSLHLSPLSWKATTVVYTTPHYHYEYTDSSSTKTWLDCHLRTSAMMCPRKLSLYPSRPASLLPSLLPSLKPLPTLQAFTLCKVTPTTTDLGRNQYSPHLRIPTSLASGSDEDIIARNC